MRTQTTGLMFLARRFASTTPKIPKSLLLKQEKRLAQSNISLAEQELVEKQKLKNQTNQLLITSLKDIAGYFNPGGSSSSEEDFEEEHLNQLRKKCEDGYMHNMFSQKFNIDLDTIKTAQYQVNEKLWISSFDALEFQEQEVLNYYLDVVLVETYGQKWADLPNIFKKIMYFRAYGSYGPRSDLDKTFLFEQVKPQDFLWLRPSPCVFSTTTNVKTMHPKELKLIANLEKQDLSKFSNGLINIYECSHNRLKHWKTKFNKPDPGTKFILWVMGLVSLYCLYEDKKYFGTLEANEQDNDQN